MATWIIDPYVGSLAEELRYSCERRARQIYPLLGVCSDSGRYIAEVDTKSSIEVIVKRLAETHIRTTGTLDIIC